MRNMPSVTVMHSAAQAIYRLPVSDDDATALLKERIKAAMDKRHWSAAELARRLIPAEDRGWLSQRLRTDEKAISLQVSDVYRIAAALGVAPAAIFGPSDVPQRFVDAFDRQTSGLREPAPAWAAGLLQDARERDAELFGDGVLRAINRLDPHDRQTALRLIGLLDHVLAKAEVP